ncbi:MAG: YdeI/OmpD-associated family protein [Arachnia sp.]
MPPASPRCRWSEPGRTSHLVPLRWVACLAQTRLTSHDPSARDFFDGLAYTHRKEWVRWIDDAKKAETRANRVRAAVDALHANRRTR